MADGGLCANNVCEELARTLYAKTGELERAAVVQVSVSVTGEDAR